MDGWVSPRLGVRFAVEGEKLRLYRPDGEPFMTFVEKLEAIRQLELQNHEMREYAERRERAVREAEEAHRRAEAARQQAEVARRRVERLAARLRELGIDPDAI
jgi:chromosomal replication initiation ATPase DnaA